MNALFGALSIIISIYIFGSYIPQMIRGEMKPHAYSWLPWFILTGISFLIQIKNGEGFWGSVTLGITTLNCFVVYLLSFKYGEKHVTRSDTISLIVSLGLLVFWIVTDQDLISAILICLIDGIAFYPTWRKSYYDPHRESVAIFAVSSLKSFLSLFALRNFVMVNWLYPVFLILVNAAFTLYLLWRRKVITKK